MSETQQNVTAQRQSANSGCLLRLVRPRMESDKWVRLGQNLDLIHESIDIAIHKGFVKGHTKELDAKLADIIHAAEDARRLLRPNTGSHRPSEPEASEGSVG